MNKVITVVLAALLSCSPKVYDDKKGLTFKQGEEYCNKNEGLGYQCKRATCFYELQMQALLDIENDEQVRKALQRAKKSTNFDPTLRSLSCDKIRTTDPLP